MITNEQIIRTNKNCFGYSKHQNWTGNQMDIKIKYDESVIGVQNTQKANIGPKMLST